MLVSPVSHDAIQLINEMKLRLTPLVNKQGIGLMIAKILFNSKNVCFYSLQNLLDIRLSEIMKIRINETVM